MVTADRRPRWMAAFLSPCHPSPRMTKRRRTTRKKIRMATKQTHCLPSTVPRLPPSCSVPDRKTLYLRQTSPRGKEAPECAVVKKTRFLGEVFMFRTTRMYTDVHTFCVKRTVLTKVKATANSPLIVPCARDDPVRDRLPACRTRPLHDVTATTCYVSVMWLLYSTSFMMYICLSVCKVVTMATDLDTADTELALWWLAILR